MLGTELLDIAFALIFGCIFLAKVLRGFSPPRKAIVMLVAGWAALGAGRFLALFIGLGSLQGSIVIWNLAATAALALLLYGLLLTFGVASAEPSARPARPTSTPTPAPTPAPTATPAAPAPAAAPAAPARPPVRPIARPAPTPPAAPDPGEETPG